MVPARAAEPLVLAVDVGSSSVKAGLFDAAAHLQNDTLVRQASPLVATPGGGVEADPERLSELVDAAVDGVLSRAGERSRRIAGVGFATLAFSVCGVDGAGRPLTPLYTYADRRASEEAEHLRGELDEAAILRRTGCPIHSAYLPARLRWLRRTQAETEHRIERFLDAGSLLFGRWFTGRAVPISRSIASWSGLLDRHRLAWDEALLQHLGESGARLPALEEGDTYLAGLDPGFARRWPALRNVPFFLAVGDGAAANVGSGCVSPRRVALTLGTTGAMRVLLPERGAAVTPGLWAYVLGPDQTLLGGALSEGGNLAAWAAETLRIPPPEEREAALRRLPPDGHGLTVLPFLEGERSPGWASGARAVFDGLSVSTTPLEMLQAGLEAVAYRFALVARLLRPRVEEPHEIVASGGALAASPYWVQLLADVLGEPIRLSRQKELTLRGAAVLTLRGLGAWATLEDVPLAPEELREPDPRRAAAYQAGLARHARLYEALLGPGPGRGGS